MQIWKYVVAGSVLTALAFIPQEVTVKQVAAPALDSNPAFASLRLQKHTPANALPARSPISFRSARANKPLSGITICVDPGHGGEGTEPGYTGGTKGIVTRQTEGDVNLRVSLLLRQYLEAAGANVVMTRISDNRCQPSVGQACELDFRPNTAKRAKADFFVSVHHNEATNKPDINYTVVFYPKTCSTSIPMARSLANSISSSMSIRNQGAKSGDYRVLNKLDGIPGVIVEASFMSNPQEDMRLASLAYNKREARAIAVGILNYYQAKGRKADINSIFAPLDTPHQARSTRAVASAPAVQHNMVERNSMFSSSLEEVTTDRSGNQVARRPVSTTSRSTSQAAVSTAKKTSTPARKTASVAKSSSSSKPSPQVKQIVESSRKNAAELQKSSSKSRVVLSERSKAMGTSRPVL